MSDGTLSGKRLADLQAKEAEKKERANSRASRQSRQLTPEELAGLRGKADELRRNPKAMQRYMRSAAVFAVVMLREEMETNPDTKARMDASKQLLSWGGIAARILKKRGGGDDK